MKTLRFRYQRSYVDINGIVIPEPLVAVTLEGPSTFRKIEASVDPSFPYALFEELDARVIGVDLSKSKPCDIALINGDFISARFAQVALRLNDGNETCAWDAPVAFTSEKLITAVIGHYHCLEYFRMNFHPAGDEFTLETTHIYPGT